jgi:RecB family exonuclease
MIDKLAAWLAASRAAGLDLVAREEPFDVDLGAARLRGRVDRIERDAAGRIVVVDLKTGTRKPAAAEIEQNPQLAAYQLAVERGGFAQGDRAGGAMLVQVGGKTQKFDEQQQRPLPEADDPGWIAATVDAMAERMHSAQFTARVNDLCRTCDVKGSCPLQPDGRQVTQ